MGKWLFAAVCALALLIAGYGVLPAYTLDRLEEAARAEDVEQLQRHIDFPALRDNLKLRLQGELRKSIGDSLPPEWDELVTAGSNLFMGPLLQHLVTPQGIAELLQGGRSLREFERELYRRHDSPGAAPPPEDGGTWHRQHWRFLGVNRVSADYGEGNAPQLRLILERQGLRWRVVDMELLQTTS